MLFELEPSVNPNKTKSKREVSAERRRRHSVDIYKKTVASSCNTILCVVYYK